MQTSGNPTCSLIRTWLWQQVENLHRLVTSLRDDPVLALAHVLVAEFAVDILRAFSTVEEKLDSIMAMLNRAQAEQS